MAQVSVHRFFQWLYAMTLEVFALCAITLLRLIPTKEIVKGKGQPILLVHGYLHQRSIWQVFQKRLEKLGYGPIYAISLGNPFLPIEEYAAKLAKKIEKIKEETKIDRIVLIGHSMGGLVSAYYTTTLAPKNSVKALITMGSPFNGTPVACIGLGPNARQMRTNSSFTKNLKEKMKQIDGTKFFHIATDCDEFVVPGASALLKENEHCVFHDMGHTALLFSKRAVQQCNEWLKKII